MRFTCHIIIYLGSAPQTETIYILRGSGAEELFSFEYVEGETNETVWPGGVPSDGTIYTEVERFPYLWLWVISYIVNSVVIFTALFCLFFTCIFHNRKYVCELGSEGREYRGRGGLLVMQACFTLMYAGTYFRELHILYP